MRSKSPNLKLAAPRCRYCNRHWRPEMGVVADSDYCKKCTNERQAAATSRLGLKHIMPGDLTGRFLLPRRFRSS